MRNLAGIAGVVTGGAANMALIAVNMVLYPPPVGVDLADPAALSDYVAALPAAALAMVLVAHNAQAFVGGWVAARVGADRPIGLAMVIGALTAIGTAANLTAVPSPLWMWADVPLNLAAAYGAGAWVASTRAGSR